MAQATAHISLVQQRHTDLQFICSISAEFLLGKHKNTYAFSIISRYQVGTDTWNLSLQKIGTHLLYRVNANIVSLKFYELSKIILWRYTMPEITFMTRTLSCYFVYMPKAWLWAHIQIFTYKVRFLQYAYFEKIFWRACKTLVKQPPGGRLNKKDGLTRYGNSHVKDKTS